MTQKRSHPLEVGDRIHHWRGDRTPGQDHPSYLAWVEAVVPQPDGTYEYFVRRDDDSDYWWPSYHTELAR